MSKRKKQYSSSNENPFWEISYEYQHGRDLIIPGNEIKFKGERSVFIFQRVVYHTEKDVTWIDCYNSSGYRAFYIDRLKGLVKVRKKRVKKNVE